MFLDEMIVELVHKLNVMMGQVLNPIMEFISFLGEKSWFFLLIAFVLCLRKKTRWVGITIIFSILVGWLLADVVIKPAIGRERPLFLYNAYWEAAGRVYEDGFSMPSGHTLGITAFFTSYIITIRKEDRLNVLKIGIIAILLMILSRCYLMHHYFTDCLVGFFIGFGISYLSKAIIKSIYKLSKKYENISLFSFILNFDAIDAFKGLFTK